MVSAGSIWNSCSVLLKNQWQPNSFSRNLSPYLIHANSRSPLSCNIRRDISYCSQNRLDRDDIAKCIRQYHKTSPDVMHVFTAMRVNTEKESNSTMWGFGHGLWFLLPVFFLSRFFWIVLLAILIGLLIRRFSFRYRQAPFYHYNVPPVQPAADTCTKDGALPLIFKDGEEVLLSSHSYHCRTVNAGNTSACSSSNVSRSPKLTPTIKYCMPAWISVWK
jgi:hypothetical protein